MENKIHYPLIRTIYLYLFAIIGLVLVVIGSVGFLNMGLKAFIFTKAEEEQRMYEKQPTMPYQLDMVKNAETLSADKTNLTEEEKTLIRQWLADYKNWQDTSAKIDTVTAQRHRDAATNLAMILVGLPLYLYHWGVIKKETKSAKQ